MSFLELSFRSSGCREVEELGRRGKDSLRNVAVIRKSDPLLCSSSDANKIRKLYKLHLVLEVSSNVTTYRDWVI